MGYFDVIELDGRWQKEFTCRHGHEMDNFEPPDTAHQWQTKALEGIRNYYQPRIYQLTATGLLVFHKELYGSDEVVDLVTPFSCQASGDWVDIYTSCKECEKTSPLDPRFGNGHAPVDVMYLLLFNNGQLVKWISEWDRRAERNNLLGERDGR